MSDIDEAKKTLLAEWERERDELNMMIARLRRELRSRAADGAQTESEPPTRAAVSTVIQGLSVEEVVTPGDFFGMTQVNAAKEFMQRRNKQTATLQEIAAALYRGKAVDSPMESAAALRNLSSLISRSREFVSVARGRWGLADWYPDRVLKKLRKVKNGDEEASGAEAVRDATERESK